ncbi:lysylphosphatidylglycerol synthase transmembrane domain-containing protein [Methyloceanibacter sp.]|uniref:lysylphosphatidylglycerol synthase transmembrane domain-containing protein n=1 Tax=Methyloceanibacter sp. TaxID=1965321 RepID=UPI003D6C9A83
MPFFESGPFADQPMPKSIPSNWIALASRLLLLAAILVIVSREHSFDTLLALWQRIEPASLALVTVVMIALQATGAWRLMAITFADGLRQVGFRPLFRIQLVSQFAADAAPISALADVAKAAMVKLRFALGTGQSIRPVLYERICGAMAAIVIGVLCLSAQLVVPTPADLVKAQAILWGVGCAGIAALIALGGFHLNTKFEFLNRLVRAVIALGHMLRSPLLTAQLLLATALLLAGYSVIFIVLAHAMQIQVSVPHVFLFTPLIFFVSSLPVFYQGWGGREAAAIATIGNTGQVTSAEAIALSVAFGIVVFLGSLPGAVFWLMRPSMRKAVRQEVEQA